MNNNRKKTIVIALIVVTILVGAMAVLLAQLVQNNQSPNSSGAAGFGDTATRDAYDDVVEAFTNLDCTNVLSGKTIFLDSPEELIVYKNKDIPTTNNTRLDYMPISCTYTLGTKKIYFELFSYNTFSYIDDSAEDLYERINNKFILEEFDQGNYYSSNFFFGSDKTGSNWCRTNIFHVQNDFEYASIVYEGFGDCSDLVELNQSVTQPIASAILNTMIGVNNRFKGENNATSSN